MISKSSREFINYIIWIFDGFKIIFDNEVIPDVFYITEE